MTNVNSANGQVSRPRTPTREDDPSLAGVEGNLGVGSIVFSVIAWAAPLLVVAGLMPSMIGFAGSGIIAGFAVTTVVLLLFAVGFTAITRYVERPGAFYTYITAGLGRQAGLGGAFVAIFGYLLLILSTWVAFGVYSHRLIADTFNGPDIPWYVLSLLGSIVAGVFSYRSIEFSAKALSIALMLEVAIVVVFDLFAFADGGPTGIATQPFTWDGVVSGNLGLAVLYAALCFIGFESTAIYREEARKPEVTIPRATYIAVILIGVFYMVSAWAMLTALGPDGIAAARDGEVTLMFENLSAAYVGAVVPDIINVLVITSTFACLLASHNAVARYGYSLGQDGVISPSFGKAHPKHRSPHIASIVVTILELVAVVVIAGATGFDSAGDDAFTVYVRVNGLGAIVVVFLMGIVSVAILAYFRRNREISVGNSWKTLVAPGIGLVGVLVILVMAIQNVGALIGASQTVSMAFTLTVPLVFVAGILVARRLRTSNNEVYQRIGRQ
jgi:amino acid transporter